MICLRVRWMGRCCDRGLLSLSCLRNSRVAGRVSWCRELRPPKSSAAAPPACRMAAHNANATGTMDPRPAPRCGIPPIFATLLLLLLECGKQQRASIRPPTRPRFEKSNRLMLKGQPAPPMCLERTTGSSEEARLHNVGLVRRSSCPQTEGPTAVSNKQIHGGGRTKIVGYSGVQVSFTVPLPEMCIHPCPAPCARQMGAMMDENGVEDISQLGGSGGTIKLALDALKEKKSSVDQVRT